MARSVAPCASMVVVLRAKIGEAKLADSSTRCGGLVAVMRVGTLQGVGVERKTD